MVKKSYRARVPTAKNAAPLKRGAAGIGMLVESREKLQAASSARKTRVDVAVGRVQRAAALASAGFDMLNLESGLESKSVMISEVPPGGRTTIAEIAETVSAHSFYAADEARLRSEVRYLQRRVAEHERQIQALTGLAAQAAIGATAAAPVPSRTARALEALRGRLADQAPLAAQAPEDARRRWVDEGILVPTAVLAEAWSVSRQALDQARTRADLIGLKIGNRQYYPAVFLDLSADLVARVCQALAGVDAVSAVLFWSRKHGFLENVTLVEAIQAGGLDTVVRAAAAFADEMAGVQAAPVGLQHAAQP